MASTVCMNCLLKRELYLQTKLGDNGVLLFPSAPQVSPYHYSLFLRPYNFGYWAILNALRCPATQVTLLLCFSFNMQCDRYKVLVVELNIFI